MASLLEQGITHLVVDRRFDLKIRDRDGIDDDHPSAGNPYTAGMANPDNGGGADGQHIPSGTEIGIIIGVVFLVFIGVSALFFRRVRRKKHVKDTEATANFNDNHIPATKGDDPPTASKKIEDERATSSSADGSALHFEDRECQYALRDG